MNTNTNGNGEHSVRNRDSSMSLSSTNSRDAKKKDNAKHRAGERRLKMESQTSEVEIGHIVDDTTADTIGTPPDFGGVSRVSSLDRSSSDQSAGSLLYDQSTGSLLYGKTPKSSSLIFPTGVEAGVGDGDSETNNLKRRKINLLLDQCESVRFLKKKLVLTNLGLSAIDIPLADLCGTPLGNSLHKLSLAGNRLGTVPARLVQNLPTLKHLDLSQCELHQLPDNWNLPQLKRLNLSHNRLTEFPEEVRNATNVSLSHLGFLV